MKKRAPSQVPHGSDQGSRSVGFTTGSHFRTWLACVFLAAFTLSAYWQAGSWGFVNLDDDAYVEFQPMVNQGLRPAAVAWALTAAHSNNWHPLTSLSQMLDCSMFGVRPGPMHRENVGWHVVNTLLVFLVLRSFTGATWRSGMVAGLFALHPAHVESVAWIAERKDLLSTCFWLLGLGAYVRYTRARSAMRYLPVALFFVLGLLSKPMVVTFPLTLLLLDYWPLRRWPAMTWRRLFVEKVPLFALAVAHGVVTLIVQVSTGAANYGERLSIATRMGNAVVSCVRYIGKSVWPSPLGPHYAHPGWWPLWAVFGAAAIVILVTCLGWWQRKPRPWFLFGWLWFLLTLLPVIGIIQVGAQSMADRYTYVPFIGLFTAGVWAAAGIAVRLAIPRTVQAVAAISLLAVCAVQTNRQASAWKDSVTLYERSIAAGEDNATIRYLLALAYQAAGHPDEAVAAQFRKAIEIAPDYTNAYTQLAMLALKQNDAAEAARLIGETIRIEPRNPALRKNLGALRDIEGKPEEAIPHFVEALRLNPSYVDANHALAWLYMKQERLDAAMHELETVVRISPWDFAAHCELGAVYYRLGRSEDARRSLQRALWIHPGYADAQLNLRLIEGENP